MDCIFKKCKKELDILDNAWKQYVKEQAKLQAQLAKASEKDKVKTQKQIDQVRQKLQKNTTITKAKACVEKAKKTCKK